MKTFAVLLLLISGAARATVLGDAAVSMAPKTWKAVDIGLVDSLYNKYGDLFVYASDAMWDPSNEKLLYMDRYHGQPWEFILYDAHANIWRKGPLPFEPMHGSHVYDDLTMNTDDGWMYYFQADGEMRRYSPINDVWETLPQLGQKPTSPGHGMAFEYFPDMGGFIQITGSSDANQLSFYNPVTHTWKRLAQGDSILMGPYHVLAEYSRVHKIVLFGGGNGSNQLYKLDAAGKITKIKAAPVEIAIHGAEFTCDPVTGTFLALSNSRLYSYDPSTDQWTDIGANPGIDNVYAVNAQVVNYGVVLYMCGYGCAGSTHVWLYKYASLTDASPPTKPANFSGAVLSEQAIHLTWNAASDPETGLRLYNIFRNGVQVGASLGLEYTDRGLTELTQYTYAVEAVNRAGQGSGQTGSIQVTTIADTVPPTVLKAVQTANQIFLHFSEALESASASAKQNYSLDNGVTVNSLALLPGNKTVVLTLSSLTPGTRYTLTLNNIQDKAQTPNSILGNTQLTIDVPNNASTGLLVDFGSTLANCQFRIPGWNQVIKDNYTGFVAAGPGGAAITVGASGLYNYQGVSGGALFFPEGTTVTVTWYNNAAAPAAFTPKISFKTAGRNEGGADWYPLSSTTLAAKGTGVSTFQFTAGAAGNYTLVNVNSNFNNPGDLICDKIELTAPAGSAVETALSVSQGGLGILANPNPFSGATAFRFQWPGMEAGAAPIVSVRIHDIQGRVVADLSRQATASRLAGQNAVVWRPRALPSGIYFLKAKCGGVEKSKILLVKH